MKRKVNSISKLKSKVKTAKKVYGTVMWAVNHKDMIVKGASTAKSFVDKKKKTAQ